MKTRQPVQVKIVSLSWQRYSYFSHEHYAITYQTSIGSMLILACAVAFMHYSLPV